MRRYELNKYEVEYICEKDELKCQGFYIVQIVYEKNQFVDLVEGELKWILDVWGF